ncbi:MAG: alpha/beta fold hydrolase [bacterium]
MAFAQTPHIKLYYERDGDGPPLLFISGSGADLRNRPNQFDAPIARAFELICYDQRGLGQTEQPAGDYTMRQYADDAAALLDYLNIDQIPVIGVSFGGMVAQEFALRHPDRVRALVLACTSSGGAGGASYPLHELQDLPGEARAAAHLKVSDLRHTGDWIAEHPETWQKRLSLALAAQQTRGNEIGARAQLEARRWHNTYERLCELRMPVLLAGGAYDGIAPVANMQALHAAIQTSELKLFSGGHMFLIQDRDSYPYIIQWLKKNI